MPSFDKNLEISNQPRIVDYENAIKKHPNAKAIFVNEKTIDLTNEIDITLEDGFYRFGENQLEVFINGTKLIKDIDFFEGTDLSNEPDIDEEGNVTAPAKRRKGAKTKQFTLLEARPGNKLTYRITTSIYTYEHVTELLEDMDYNAQTAVNQVNTLYDKTVFMQEQVEGKVNELYEEIEKIKDISTNLENNYLTTNSVLSESQMPPTISEVSPFTKSESLNKKICFSVEPSKT